ncbi:MAG: hypothetical protein MMC23_003667 [Stictis urceolatum]|nr:hypothetical protein [Stictis urceolata]
MSSIHLHPSASAPSHSTTDTLLTLSRQSAHLQQSLQSLLDAQSAGLSAGLGHPTQAPQQQRRPSSSTRQPSRSSLSPRPSSRVPAANSRIQSQKKPSSLSDARSGLYTTLLALAANKSSEAQTYSATAATYSTFLENALRLTDKKETLQSEIRALESGPEIREIAELGDEEEELQAEVRALEEELAVKKARLRDVRLRRERAGNQHESRLSSWRRALEDVDGGIKEEILEGRGLGVERGERKEGVWALPKARRTVEMVREGVEGNMEQLKDAGENANVEGQACVEGAETWKACVKVLGRVERALRKEIMRLRGGTALERSRRESVESETSGSSAVVENGSPEDGMQGVLHRMDAAIAELGGKHLRLAKEKGWNPVIVAIGAELEALVEGREMLERAFGLSQVTLDGLRLEDTSAHLHASGRDRTSSDKDSVDGAQDRPRLVDLAREDEPNPDLLVSHTEYDRGSHHSG